MALTNPNKELKRKFAELADETNAKYGVSLSGEDVLRILETQFEVVPSAIQEGGTVKLPYIGKFTPISY